MLAASSHFVGEKSYKIRWVLSREKGLVKQAVWRYSCWSEHWCFRKCLPWLGTRKCLSWDLMCNISEKLPQLITNDCDFYLYSLCSFMQFASNNYQCLFCVCLFASMLASGCQKAFKLILTYNFSKYFPSFEQFFFACDHLWKISYSWLNSKFDISFPAIESYFACLKGWLVSVSVTWSEMFSDTEYALFLKEYLYYLKGDSFNQTKEKVTGFMDCSVCSQQRLLQRWENISWDSD